MSNQLNDLQSIQERLADTVANSEESSTEENRRTLAELLASAWQITRRSLSPHS